ncbi:MAG: Type secretion system protein virB10 [Gemmatimonadetes bacterium]|nr:Type secretion system protein virB10 [Gemmatimonadota bacterium]
MRIKPTKPRSGPPSTSPAPGSTPRPDVKRLSSKPVVIAGATLLFVALAVAFLVTSRPKADDPTLPAVTAGGPPAGPATADFLANDPTAAPAQVPGPECQGMECAARVAGGTAPSTSAADSAALARAVGQQPYAGPAGANATAPAAGPPPTTDPYATTYGAAPQPAAPAAPAAPAVPECDRRCRYRAARGARLPSELTGASGAAPATAGQQFQPGPDGLMPDAYYNALADSMMRAEVAGSVRDAAGAPHSVRNAGGASQLATAPAADAGRAAPAPQAPVSPYVVSAGTLIPAALETGINSDLCGNVKAVVTRDVYDARLRVVLIPAGAELLGTCSDQVAGGQARLAVAWTRLRFPDGHSLTLPGLPTHSEDGRSGVRDKVNNHWGRVFGAAVLLSALGAGVQLGVPQETDGGSMTPAQTAATAAATELSTLATEILRRNLEVKPTIEIRPATPFIVFVASDLDVGAPAARPRAGGAQ